MMFLKVPFAEKEEAKALGARWNGERKSWYVPDGKPTEPFARWAAASGAEYLPAKPAGAPKEKPASVDTRAAKPVVGKYYLELPHDCSPFEVCPQCAPKLQESGWQAAHDAVLQMLAAVRA